MGIRNWELGIGNWELGIRGQGTETTNQGRSEKVALNRPTVVKSEFGGKLYGN